MTGRKKKEKKIRVYIYLENYIRRFHSQVESNESLQWLM